MFVISQVDYCKSILTDSFSACAVIISQEKLEIHVILILIKMKHNMVLLLKLLIAPYNMNLIFQE